MKKKNGTNNKTRKGTKNGTNNETSNANRPVFLTVSQLDKSYGNGGARVKFLDGVTASLAAGQICVILGPSGSGKSISFNQLAPLCLFAAVVIYLVLMVVLTKLVIDKNALYISYLKVFGYETAEISKLYLRATTTVVLGSLILSLPLVKLGIQGSFFLV